MSEVKITPNGIKQAIADLLNEKELLQEENKRLYKSLEEQRHFYLEKLQQKKNIIKEAREYIENNNLYEEDYDYDYEENLVVGPPSDETARKILLDILGKEKHND